MLRGKIKSCAGPRFGVVESTLPALATANHQRLRSVEPFGVSDLRWPG